MRGKALFAGLGFAAVLLIAFALPGCEGGQKTRVDLGAGFVDLAGASLFGVEVGQNIDEVDLGRFTPADENEFWDYAFAQLLVDVDEGDCITKIQSAGPLRLIGEGELSTANEVEAPLGEGHNDYRFDFGQGLRAHTYFDGENEIALTVVFVEGSHEFVWAVLEKRALRSGLLKGGW